MIISYKHSFVFWKPPKTAGTSIQCGFGGVCGEEDIVTPINPTPQSEGYDIIYVPRNYKNFDSHMIPMSIHRKMSKKNWDDFFKVTIVRNPWDLCVSKMWWDLTLQHTRKGKDAANMVAPQKIKECYCHGKMDNYYFHPKTGAPLADFYIRYENINSDYEKACKKIGIPYKKPPKLKGKIRKQKRKYTTYYDDKTKQIVANSYRSIISHFGYKFGD